MEKSELGLVDKLIYEAYKDRAVNGMNYFKKKIKSDYGIIPSSDLYRKIINYQIKKYWKQLNVDLGREYERLFYERNVKSRKNNIERAERRNRQIKILDRLENEK